LTLCQVTHEPGKYPPLAPPRLADCQFDWKRIAIPVKRGGYPADADDLALSGRKIIEQILVMPFAVG